MLKGRQQEMRGKLAGLDVLRIINEPTAASLAYGLGIKREEQKTIAVYDLGGGTFDVSVLKIDNGVFEVLSTNGDTYLGGDDFDMAIVKYWQGKINISDEELLKDPSLMQSLRLISEEAKKFLSHNDFFTATLNEKNLSLHKNDFNNLIKILIDKTIVCCKKAMKDAGIALKEIDEIIMVGGSTRVPLVNEMVGARRIRASISVSASPSGLATFSGRMQSWPSSTRAIATMATLRGNSKKCAHGHLA